MSLHLRKLAASPNGSKLRFIHRQAALANRRLIKGRDLTTMLLMLVAAPLVSVLPQSLCIRLGRLMGGLGAFVLDHVTGPSHAAAAGGVDRQSAKQILRESRRERITALMLFLRGLIRGPRYLIQVEGKGHIDAALKAGNGAVLWIADFVYAGDISKIGLHAEGYLVSHLSRPEHGFSDTVFGLRFLNPLRTNFELRYLRERVVYRRDQPGEATGKLIERLKSNCLVSILASAYEGRSVLETDFLNGRIQIARGAPKTAYAAAAPILPVFVVPAAEPPAFRVIIEAPLAMSSRDREIAETTATRDFLSRLEANVRRRPGLWRGWAHLRVGDNEHPLAQQPQAAAVKERLGGKGAPPNVAPPKQRHPA